MNDPSKTRIHHRGEGSWPVVAPQLQTSRGHEVPVPFVRAEPEAEPVLSLFERAIIMVTCIAVMAFVVVNFVIYYRVYVALQEVARMVESVPGLGN